MPLAKNDIITLEITALTNEGSGVGHYKEDSSDGRGMAVFVPLTAVGDVISCRVVKVLRSYAYGTRRGYPHRLPGQGGGRLSGVRKVWRLLLPAYLLRG